MALRFRESSNIKPEIEILDTGLIDHRDSAFPQAVQLPNGDLLCSFNVGGGPNVLGGTDWSRSTDGGNTWNTIEKALRGLDYTIYDNIIDARKVVPQHRERIFIVGTKIGDAGFEFSMPTTEEIQKEHDGPKTTLGEILEDNPDPSFTLQDGTWRSLQNHKEKHEKAGNGFGFGLVTGEQTTRTLSARYHKDGSEILVEQPGKNPRRLTPRECARLMGFSEDHKIEVSDRQAYQQFGNAVVVPVAQAIARKLVEAVLNPKIVTRTADGYFPGQERNLAFGPEEEVA